MLQDQLAADSGSGRESPASDAEPTEPALATVAEPPPPHTQSMSCLRKMDTERRDPKADHEPGLAPAQVHEAADRRHSTGDNAARAATPHAAVAVGDAAAAVAGGECESESGSSSIEVCDRHFGATAQKLMAQLHASTSTPNLTLLAPGAFEKAQDEQRRLLTAAEANGLAGVLQEFAVNSPSGSQNAAETELALVGTPDRSARGDEQFGSRVRAVLARTRANTRTLECRQTDAYKQILCLYNRSSLCLSFSLFEDGHVYRERWKKCIVSNVKLAHRVMDFCLGYPRPYCHCLSLS